MDGSSSWSSRSGSGVPPAGYRLGNAVGYGGFAYVKVGEHILTGHKVAIKVFNRSQINSAQKEEEVKREIKIMKMLNHPHIARLYEVIETKQEILVVMEYGERQELYDYIVMQRGGKLHDDEARKFFQQIICGVEYCHRNMVAHRDLKNENVVLDSNYNVKIIDFGLSNIMRDGHFFNKPCGTQYYASPEVISGDLYAGPEADVWSCGIMLYTFLCGTFPFDDNTEKGDFNVILRKIMDGKFRIPSHVSPAAADLIRRILVVDPMKRITIPEIRRHSWFQPHLPRYLTVPPPTAMQQAMQIDEEILQEVVKMGFERNHLVHSLHNRTQNQGTVAYYLLVDNRRGVPTGYLGAEIEETLEPGFNNIHSTEPTARALGHHLLGYSDNQAMGLRGLDRKWALGLQSRAHPREIMTEVLQALKQLDVWWKNIGHYNIKARWLPIIADNHEGMVNNGYYYPGDESTSIKNGVTKLPNVVKFEVQLYKTREDQRYLLDLQRLQGPQFLFLELCAAFLTQLRVV